MITGALDGWSALRTWSPESFARRFGELEVDVYRDFFDVDAQMPFTEYYERFLGSSADAQGGYVRWFSRMRHGEGAWADAVFDALASEWTIPPFCPVTDYVVPPARRPRRVNPVTDQFPYRGLFISGPGGRTRLHRDPWTSSALLCQIHGHKRFLFYSPDQQGYLMVGGDYVDPAAVDTERFPRFDRARVTYEGVLEPGEVLFIPSGWFHDVTTLSNSISLTWNFVHRVGERAFRDFVAAHPGDEELVVARYFGAYGSESQLVNT